MKKNFENILGGAIANSEAGEKAIKDRIIIRDEFKKLIPPLSPDELEQLEVNILKEGVRDPIVLWENGIDYILVDGHNRFSICSKHSLSFPFKIVQFKDEEEVNDWMIKNQLGRRNLTSEQQSYLRGLRYLRERTTQDNENLTGQNVPRKKEDTSERLANEYNVSPKTIKRDAQFAQGVELIGKENPELKKEILKGKSKISKKDVEALVKKPQKEIKATVIEKPKLTVNELAAIAIKYAMTETKPFNEVVQELSLNNDHLEAINFFVAWDNSQKEKANYK